MQKGILLLPLLFFAMAWSVNAQELENRQTDRLQRIEEVRQQKENRFTEMRQNTAERKIKINEKARTNIQKRTGNIENMLSNVALSLGGFVERIDFRIFEMEDRGFDLSKSKLLIEDIKEDVEDVKISIESASESINNELSQEEVSNDVIRSIVSSVKGEILETRKSMKNLISTIREEVVSQSEELRKNSEIELEG